MPKQCESYEFKVSEDPVRLWVRIRPFKNDVWSGFRIVANMGKRMAAELKTVTAIQVEKPLHAEVVTIPPECCEIAVTFTTADSISKETMENVAHSLYLWLEHPEKY